MAHSDWSTFRQPVPLASASSGFAVFSQDVTIRKLGAIQVKAALEIAGGQTSVTVEAAGATCWR